MLTAAVHSVLSGDATLVSMLAEYKGEPAIFTTDPAPGDAVLPYIVSAGSVADFPFDTKNSRGRSVVRDVRCYASPGGSVQTVVQISERVRVLLHRTEILVSGFRFVFSSCDGPTVADELESYGRIVTYSVTLEAI